MERISVWRALTVSWTHCIPGFLCHPWSSSLRDVTRSWWPVRKLRTEYLLGVFSVLQDIHCSVGNIYSSLLPRLTSIMRTSYSSYSADTPIAWNHLLPSSLADDRLTCNSASSPSNFQVCRLIISFPHTELLGSSLHSWQGQYGPLLFCSLKVWCWSHYPKLNTYPRCSFCSQM